MGVFNKLFGRLKLTSDPNVATQTTAVIQAEASNTSIAIVPNGTGAIIASIPDGTATGGNARGMNAVDLQQNRSVNNQVAAGVYSVIINGSDNKVISIATRSTITNGIQNTANSTYSFIGNGAYNTVGSGGSTSYGTIVNGNSNIIVNGDYCFIGSGSSNNINGFNQVSIVITGGSNNSASTSYSTISGGQSNTASTNTHATVVGGQGNTASGQHSVTGGQNNTVSGDKATAFGVSNNVSGYGGFATGSSNTIAGSRSIALGQSNSAAGSNSIALGLYASAANKGTFAVGEEVYSESNYGISFGYRSNTKLYTQQALASGYFGGVGDAQQSLLTARNSSALTTGATLVLSLDGTGTTNLIIPNGNNRAWNVQIDTIAVVTAITGTATGVSVGDCYSETKQLLFKRIGGTSSIVGTVDTTAVKSDTSMATASLSVSAGASQEMALTFTAPTFSGGGSVTVRTVSKVSLVEVAY